MPSRYCCAPQGSESVGDIGETGSHRPAGGLLGIADHPQHRKPDLRHGADHEVAAWEQVRNEQHATVSWHVTTVDARQKLDRFYPS